MSILTSNKPHRVLFGTLCALLSSACAYQTDSLYEVENSQTGFYGIPNDKGELFAQQSAPQQVFASDLNCDSRQFIAAPLNYRVDKPIELNAPGQTPPMPGLNKPNALPLSPGDIVRLSMEYGEGFNGDYVIDNIGVINLPIVSPVLAAGNTTSEVAREIERSFMRANIFRPDTANVNISVLHWAAIDVPVTGAVFQPGRVGINHKNANAILSEQFDAAGDYSNKRLLSEAIRAASGVRPDAKIEQVILIRNGWQIEVDLSGILSGTPVKDYPLIDGDQVIVPSTGCFQPFLVRPSQITPKGFRVFMSNLIDSASSNSAAGVGRYSTNIPYGTRLLQAAISANCVGGKEWTNAPRKVVLASTNPITNKTEVIERSVEQLMRLANRDDVNPYLMPNDAVACYDSGVTNLRDVASTVLEILTPLKLL